MKFQQLFTPLALATLALGRPQARAPKKALYMLDSDPNGASIVAMEIAPDGTLSKPTRTSTGGNGLIGLNADGPVDKDALFSQNSVVVSGQRLFTVNAGSNTMAMFHIRKNDPLNPVLLGEPINTGGDVPTTVAFSPKNKMACVANTGPRAGVQCFVVSGCGSMEPAGDFMPLPINQTNPPVGPINTVSDIQFNPSQTALFVSVKGDTMEIGGSIFAYPIVDGKIVEQPVVSQGDDLVVSFGFSFTGECEAILTDAAYGASLVNIADDLTVSVTKKVAVANQGATCWSVYSERFNAAYILDSLVPSITTLDPTSGAEKFLIPIEDKNLGAFDAALDDTSLYVLQGSAAVAVIDLAGTKSGEKIPVVKQEFDMTDVGPRAGLIGLAVFK
jgi:hypothetical protein